MVTAYNGEKLRAGRVLAGMKLGWLSAGHGVKWFWSHWHDVGRNLYPFAFSSRDEQASGFEVHGTVDLAQNAPYMFSLQYFCALNAILMQPVCLSECYLR